MNTMYLRLLAPLLLLLPIACGDTESGESGEAVVPDDDPFAGGGKTDNSGIYQFQPEAGPLTIEPNTERVGDRLYYQPYVVESVTTEEGEQTNIYHPDDAWRQVWRYFVTVEEPGAISIDAMITYPPNSGGLLGARVGVQVFQIKDEGNERVGAADFRISGEIPPGTYGIAIVPQTMPVATEAQDAYIEFDLQVGFEPL